MTSPTMDIPPRAPTPAPFEFIDQKLSDGFHWLRLGVRQEYAPLCAQAFTQMQRAGAFVKYDRQSPYTIYVVSKIDATRITLRPLLEKVEGLTPYLRQLINTSSGS